MERKSECMIHFHFTKCIISFIQVAKIFADEIEQLVSRYTANSSLSVEEEELISNALKSKIDLEKKNLPHTVDSLERFVLLRVTNIIFIRFHKSAIIKFVSLHLNHSFESQSY